MYLWVGKEGEMGWGEGERYKEKEREEVLVSGTG